MAIVPSYNFGTRSIFEMLKEYAKDHAVLIITHDLRVIPNTDYVYILGNGVIAEEGKPEKLLLSDDSYFKNLLKLQKVNYKIDLLQ